MFWRLFVKESPLLDPSLDSALEGIVFKEGKGRLFKRFWKKRLLAYDEVAKCLRYYTPQRALKGTIHLHDILFITPGRSSGRDVRKDSVFEITVPGRVYVFHVNNIRETKKWIGILSRELDSLKIRDRLQLNNGNLIEGTYSKTLRPNSTLLSSLRIGEHREHEECCFLFDEEHQHKVIALESLCSLQAMKIYELTHSVEKIQKKCDDLEAPPSEEIKRLKDQYHKLRVSFEKEKLQVLDLQAAIEEAESKKIIEENNVIKKVVPHHQPTNLREIHVERREANKAKKPTRTIASSASAGNLSSNSNNNNNNNNFNNNNNSDNKKMEEIKKLQDELEYYKKLLAIEKAKANDYPYQSGFNFPSPASSPSLSFEPRTRSPASPLRSSSSSSTPPLRLSAIHENSPITDPKHPLYTYKTFSPTLDHLQFHREPSPQQLGTNPPSSPLFSNPIPPFLRSNSQNGTPIFSPQPRYPPQPLHLDPPASTASSSPPPTQPNIVSQSPEFLHSQPQTIPLISSSPHSSTSSSSSAANSNPKQPEEIHSNGITPKNSDINRVVSVSSTKSTTFKSVKTVGNSDHDLMKDFNMATVHSPPTKLRSKSETGHIAPFKTNASHPNGKVNGLNDVTPPHSNGSIIQSISTTTSSTTTTTTSQLIDSLALSNKIDPELSSLLNSPPDDNSWAVQAVSKLNDALAEIKQLSVQLRAERQKLEDLQAEKAHMLEEMEDMKAERIRTRKLKEEMEDLMVATEGQLNATRDLLASEVQRRADAEEKLKRLTQAQSALQQSILDDDMPPPPAAAILQSLLTN